MADSSPRDDVFDVEKIRELVELMEEHELGELDLRQGDVRIQLVRAPGTGVPVAGAKAGSMKSMSNVR